MLDNMSLLNCNHDIIISYLYRAIQWIITISYDNIHKGEDQEIRWEDEHDKYKWIKIDKLTVDINLNCIAFLKVPNL